MIPEPTAAHVDAALRWCGAIRESVQRYLAVNVWAPDGRLDRHEKRRQDVEAYILVMVTNQLQDSLNRTGLRHLRKLLPREMIYALRVREEHGDANANAAYVRKGGEHGGWRASGPTSPPHIGDVDFGEIAVLVDEIEAALEALEP